MPDKLQEMYAAWAKEHELEDLSLFQAFQAGFSASAVSMRERAIAAVRANVKNQNELNAAVNAIGALSDIPS